MVIQIGQRFFLAFGGRLVGGNTAACGVATGTTPLHCVLLLLLGFERVGFGGVGRIVRVGDTNITENIMSRPPQSRPLVTVLVRDAAYLCYAAALDASFFLVVVAILCAHVGVDFDWFSLLGGDLRTVALQLTFLLNLHSVVIG